MATLKAAWTDEQILEINGRALELYEQATLDHELPVGLAAAIYQGILNMCGQVEPPKVTPGSILPRMDLPRKR